VRNGRGFAGGVGGHDIVAMTAEDYDRMERANDLPPGKTIKVQYQWDVSYKECGFVYNDLIPELEKIAKEHGVSDEHVRYVFGFDS
jgi:hypothetical protein